MAEEALRAELARVADALWRDSAAGETAAGETAVSWLPLIPISESGLWLGVDRQGEWILGRLGGRPASSAAGLPQSWLTILDMDEAEFWDRLDRAAAKYQLSAQLLHPMVPIDAILAMGLRSHSSHWAERAVRWLTGRPLTGEHTELLRALPASRWASQWTRQTARRLVSASQ